MRKLYVIAIAIFFCLYACTKIDSTTLGSGLIPTIDRVNTFDTLLDVTTANFSEENIPRVFKANDHVIGAITNDPLFGNTTASAYFQLKPATYPFYFPGKKTDLTADSAVLVLSYKGVFGDTTIPQTWNVYEVDKNSEFRYDSAYPVNTKYNTGVLLGSGVNLDIRTFNDPVRYRFDSSINQIRIKLNKSIADLLIIQYDSSSKDPSNNAYQNDSVFREKFAGFAVVPQGNGNALVRINLSDTNTKLSLYYKFKATDASTTKDTAVANFRFSPGSASVAPSANANFVTRDHKSSRVTNYLNTNKADEVFIQTSPGTFATVKVPGLRTFGNVIVHRAELIAEQEPFDAVTDAQFSAPRFLLLSAFDSAKKYKINIPNDFTYTPDAGPNIETFGGLLTNKSVPLVGIVGSYTFNLTRYVQGIVSRKDSSYTLRLSAPVNDSLKYTAPYPFQSSPATMLYISPEVANPIAIGRVRLGGGTNTRVRMRLRIIYSRI
jgi:hypothetical protein